MNNDSNRFFTLGSWLWMIVVLAVAGVILSFASRSLQPLRKNPIVIVNGTSQQLSVTIEVVVNSEIAFDRQVNLAKQEVKEIVLNAPHEYSLKIMADNGASGLFEPESPMVPHRFVFYDDGTIAKVR